MLHSSHNKLLRVFLLVGIVFAVGSLIMFGPNFKSETNSVKAQSTVSINQNHPRLWITPAQLATMKSEMTLNSPRWVYTKKQADTDLNGGKVNMLAEAIVDMTTGDHRYCADAIPTLVSYTTTFDRVTDSSYNYRNLNEPALVYDWCHAQMSAADIATVSKWALDTAEFVWPETNPARNNAWGVNNPGNNYFNGFLESFPLAIAALGDDARAQNMIDLGYNSKYQMALTYLNGEGKGGWYHESTNYDLSISRLTDFLDAYDTATATPANPRGLNLMNSTSFITDSIYWRIYSSTPDLKNFFDLGDASRISNDPMAPYDLWKIAAAQTRTADATAAAYGKFWIDSLYTTQGNRWEWVDPWLFIYYNSKAPSTDYTKVPISTSYYAPGSGVLTDRSDWTTGATLSEIWAGPLDQSHQYNEINGFQIWKNGALAGNASKWSQSGILQGTVQHNTLTFGANGIQAKNGSNSGFTKAHDSGSDYSYLSGEAAKAYDQNCSHGCKKAVNDFTRDYTYIKPIDTFVVYDRTDIVDATQPKEFNLHSQKQVAINGRSYSFDNGKTALCGQSLLPTTGTTLNSVAENFGNANATSSYDLVISSSNNLNKENLLNVMQLSNVGSCNLTTSAISSPAGMDGAEIQTNNGSWAVLNGQSDVINTSVTYTVSKATEHVVTNLKPNTNYTGTVNVNSNAAGVVRFHTAAGVTSITLNPGGQIVAPPPGAAPPAPAPAPNPAPAPTAPALAVTKAVDKSSANLGDTLTYTITVNNTGNAAATNVVISDPLPANTDFVSASNGGTFDATTGNITYPGFSLAAGANVKYTLILKIQGGAAAPAPAPSPSPTPAPTPTPTPSPSPSPSVPQAPQGPVSWVQLTEPFKGSAGDAFAVAVAKDGTLYASRFGKGVAKSTDNGKTWNAIAGLTGTASSMAFNSADELLVGMIDASNIGHVFRQTSNGFVQAANITGNPSISKIVVNKAGTIFASTFSGAKIWKSTDNGTTFVKTSDQVGSGGGVEDLVVYPNGVDMMLGGEMASGIYKSSDGVSWTNFGLDAASGWLHNNQALAFTKTGEEIASRDNGNQGVEVRRSGVWTASGAGIDPYTTTRTILLNPTTGTLFLGTGNGKPTAGSVYKSTDDAKTWQKINSGFNGVGVGELLLHPDGSLVMMCQDGTVWKTTNAAP